MGELGRAAGALGVGEPDSAVAVGGLDLGAHLLPPCFFFWSWGRPFARSTGLFGFDPLAFMDSLPLQRTAYIHVAGHYTEPDGLIIDTHGAEVIDPVWSLLAAAYERMGGTVPTCLERDFNFGDFSALTADRAVFVLFRLWRLPCACGSLGAVRRARAWGSARA